MNKFSWRENEFFLETLAVARYAWHLAKTTKPEYVALAGIASMFLFSLVLPLLLHIFFDGVDGVVGATLGFLSGIIGSILRVFGFVTGLACWGVAARTFIANNRPPKA